ncbi:unnamed protein product [Polarella glacialis]|uniref:Transglutaminase-like domain-containing protein n=1 Tax=Polarella glacialis TaxID=89957 RepID=A0A813H7T8_POLGL|nr:unnamed protein product [Polarella glacialis]
MASLEASALASAEEIFGEQISDHLPLEFKVSHPGFEGEEVDIFSWNVMARALCRPASLGTSGSSITNNGLELDETIPEYRRRLMDRVAPVLTSWIRSRQVHKRRRWVACLQEAPGHPGLRREFLRAVEAGCGDLQQQQLHCVEKLQSAFACSVTMWDDRTWNLSFCASASEPFHVLCTVLATKADHVPRLRANLLRASPVDQLALAVGDINVDLSDADVVSELAARCREGSRQKEMLREPVAVGSVQGSAVYRGQAVTSDAAVLAQGQASACTSVLEKWDPLGGLSREGFIKQRINFSLHDWVRQLESLSDEDLGSLGAHHFGDQASELQGSPFGIESRQEKHIHRRRLQNSVAGLTDQELWLLGQLHFSAQPGAAVPQPTSVPGLEEQLAQLGLQVYQEAASSWCRDMGAVSLHEVQENAEVGRRSRSPAAVVPRIFTELRASRKVTNEPNATPVVFKANCTPAIMAPISETLHQGYASCTGMSILVVNGLRSVGIPARVVGTPLWNVESGGNHNWVEVWTGEGDDGWQFFDAAPTEKLTLNEAWFVPGNTMHAVKGTKNGIYSSEWTPSDVEYPLTWRDPAINWRAKDVTAGPHRLLFGPQLQQVRGMTGSWSMLLL